MLVGWMGREVQELANVLYKTVNTEHYGLHLLPLGRVRAGNQGSLIDNLNQVAIMPVPFLMDGSVPVVVVAEGTGAAITGTSSMESGEAMVALDCVRNSSRRRRSDRCDADTTEVFVRGGSVVVDLCRLHDVVEKFGGLNRVLSAVVPR